MNEWGPEHWSALADMILAIGLVSAGIWAIFTFWKAQTVESARWLTSILRDFYVSDRFNVIRDKIEYEYEEVLAPLIERRLINPEIPITACEVETLRELDTLLNYFENLLYLEKKGTISKKDRMVLFEYWFDLICQPDKAALRRYLANFGWERVTKSINGNRHDYIALYGILREGQKGYDELGLAADLERVGECELRGAIYDLGDYPALVEEGQGIVRAELYLITNREVFKTLDEYERFDARNPTESLYRRKLVRLLDQPRDAWVYLYNQEIGKAPRIESGDWIAHLNSRNS